MITRRACTYTELDSADKKMRLADAAPEMLEALKMAEMWVSKLIADNGHLNTVAPYHALGTLRKIREAIAKAEGKEKG